VPAAIHVTPEAAAGGAIGKIRDGDIVRIDSRTGELHLEVDAATLAAREAAPYANRDAHGSGLGRELFARFRAAASPADAGASFFGDAA
jgi:phosphogluconate dehydratase